MKTKIIITSLFLLLTQNFCLASSISGVVKYQPKAFKGTLFIFAKKYDGSMPMPLAVKKIVSPKFPIRFNLSAKDKMMPSIPFKGPFTVVARLSPSGSAMDKSGIEISTTKPIKIGQKNIELVLKKTP